MQRILPTYGHLSRRIHDCIACLLRPLLRMGSVCGISTLSIHCRHSDNLTSIARFDKSSKLLIISFVLSIPMLLGIIENLREILSFEGNTMRLLGLLVEILFSVGAATCWIFSLSKYKEKVIELNGLSAIIENRQFYGINTFLSTGTTKIFLRRIYLMISFIVLIDFNFILYCLDEEKDIEVHLLLLKVVMIAFCSYAQAAAILQCLLSTCLYVTLYQKCFFHIEKALDQRIIHQKRQICQKQQIAQVFPLEVTLQRLIRLYLGLTYNHRQLVVYMNPSFTIWWLVLMSILILCFYFLVIVYIRSEFGDPLLVSRSYGSVFGIIMYVATIERLNIMSQDILSFLFKYPISKLSRAEAAQVELLITTLNIQKPVLNASDIFTVGTRLLASISGTVVTYVLVALQFRASWTK
ncbi:hypothetical protein ILUMI_06753 [Ignelater luminosus]|uniref:Gustatory receptor n=1 Tax=Ignelater luminosus TaxID=2038154 RepID=A0A8K0DAI2_IGNLU|nr:hypothetical protein ILUMI_06753 [Ignelater luminosus]